MHTQAKLWNRMAKQYSKAPIKNRDAYEKKLEISRGFFDKNTHVLEFGCGTGSTAISHAPYVKHILAIDISDNMLKIATKKAKEAGIDSISFRQNSVEDLEASNDEFDVVLALSVLHLLENPKSAIEKVFKIVKPGGVFISSTACLGDVRAFWKHLLPVGQFAGVLPPVNMFTRDELFELIQSSGFRLEYEYRPSIKEAVFFVFKKLSQGAGGGK